MSLKRIRQTPEQIIRQLRKADTELTKGTALSDTCKALGVSGTTSIASEIGSAASRSTR